MEWNVWRYNINAKTIEPYNVFNHSSFAKEVAELKRTQKDYPKFEAIFRSIVMYYYWSKAEWEVVITGFGYKEPSLKVDVYSQLLMNWEKFAEYTFKEELIDG